MSTLAVLVGAHLLTTYLFGLVMGWLLWGVQAPLNAPLPGYRGPMVAQVLPGRHTR